MGDVTSNRRWRALVINVDDAGADQDADVDADADAHGDADQDVDQDSDQDVNQDDDQVSQVECGATSLPPLGCLQYHTGTTGTV